jgi:hypothetical protein
MSCPRTHRPLSGYTGQENVPRSQEAEPPKDHTRDRTANEIESRTIVSPAEKAATATDSGHEGSRLFRAAKQPHAEGKLYGLSLSLHSSSLWWSAQAAPRVSPDIMSQALAMSSTTSRFDELHFSRPQKPLCPADPSVKMRRRSPHFVSVGRQSGSSCKCERKHRGVSVEMLYRRAIGDNPPYLGEEERVGNRSVSRLAIRGSRYRRCRRCGVPRRTGGRPLVLRVSEMGGAVIQFPSAADQVVGRLKRSPTGGEQPPIGISHFDIVQGNRIAIRHVNLSVFFDFGLSSKHDHWSPATVCYRPMFLRSTQCGGVIIGFLVAPHDRD